MRIPLIMRYPNLVRSAVICTDLVLNIDLAPTLLELAGVQIPGTMQGQSWLGALQGRPGRESFLYEYFQENGDRFKRPAVLAVRTKRWKYVTYPLDSSLISELYDLQADPEELNNLIDDPGYAGTLSELKDELDKLKQQTGFRFPTASRQ
ncbi:MAG TPA: sulfatase/phosphatase domain-containing protein, partial [Sedimentisphaerales bacterium]|nr:sulfatase/phosphatase domain-containing protein [Sedimentisphaerales bacterium]